MRRRSGQAAVLLALSLFAMLLLLAMATNMGTLVNDRIRMQETADLSTYAVAYSEAAALNQLVAKNEEIAAIVKDCRRQLESGTAGGPWMGTPPCGPATMDVSADNVIRDCKMRLDDAILEFAQAARYAETVAPALAAGRATARENFDGAQANTTFFEDVSGSPTKDGTYHVNFDTNIMGWSGSWSSIAEYEQVSDVMLSYSIQIESPTYCTFVANVPSVPVPVKAWFYKDSDDPDVWVAGRVAGTPRNRFLDTAYGSGGSDGGYFGASSTGGDDLLVSYAVAKPYDGSVGPSRGGPAMRSATTLHPNAYVYPGVFWSHAVEYPKFTMVDEYRARFAGIQDGLAGDTTPRELIEQDASDLGRSSWDMSRFEH